MLEAAVIGITGVLLALQIRHTKPEYAVYLSVATGVFLLLLAAQRLEVVVESVRLIQSSISIQSSYIQVLLKIIGITYIGQFSSGICKDAGYGSIGAQIEIFTKLYIMVLSMPVLLALMETIHGFLS